MSLRIALTGCGKIADRYYLPALKELQNQGRITLACCCDCDEQKTEKALMAGFQTAYTDMDEMIQKEHPDALIMTLPVEITAQKAMETAHYRIPMMIEKPPALTKESALRLSDVLKENHVLYQIAFNRHFIPVARDLKKRLSTEKVENIQVQMCRIGRYSPEFYTTAIHAIDLLRFLADSEYESVSFSYQDLPEHGPHVSNYTLNCSFKNGVKGQILVLVDCGIVNERIFAACKKRSYFAALPVWECSDSPGGIRIYQNDRQIESIAGPPIGTPIENSTASGFYGEISHFAESVEKGIQPEENMDYAIPLVDIAERLHHREAEYHAES